MKTADPSSDPIVVAHWGVVGALLGFLAVLAGAFGAHAVRAWVPPDRVATFETASRYQMFHALALIAVGSAIERRPHVALVRAAWLFLTGIVLFSGSLYALALTGVRWLGAVTPFGGLGFLAGWCFLAWGLWRRRAT